MTQSGTSFHSRQTYFPYGAQRTTEGSALPTDYTFTGQKSDDSTGLMFYGARYYDATLGRFAQPDTIVPGAFNPQAFNRYAYALNNPVRYTDPTGHMVDEGTDGGGGGTDEPAEEEETEEETACAENDTDCDGVADDEQTDTPADTGNEQGPDDDKPGKNDLLDLIVPSHAGFRVEVSGGFGIPIWGPVGIGPNFAFGANLMCNRISLECGANVDLGGQLAVQGSGGGASITGGVLAGWGASSLKDIVNGTSGTFTALGCLIVCAEGSVSAPVNIKIGANGSPMVEPVIDSKTGIQPATLYLGGGLGAGIPEIARAVIGAGVGLSQSWGGTFSLDEPDPGKDY